MTKQTIVQRLLEGGHISVDEVTVLLESKTETVTVPYHINNNDYWYSTIS